MFGPLTLLDRIAMVFSTARGVIVLTLLAIIFLTLGIAMFLIRKLGLQQANWMPVIIARSIAWLLRVNIQLVGEPISKQRLMLAANHTTWMDILVMNALGRMYFIAKQDIGNWPIVGPILKTSDMICVNRESRQSVRHALSEIEERLDRGHPIVLFAEGTTTDGLDVLPFRSSFFGIVPQDNNAAATRLQACAIVYTHRNGLRLRRYQRVPFSWIGDMTLLPHMWDIITGGPIDVTVSLGKPIQVTHDTNRKKLSNDLENQVRDMVGALLYS